MEDFISKVLKNLNANGFPEKKVSFPMETLYEAAENNGLSFNDVRDKLTEQGISTKINDEKIVFNQEKAEESKQDMFSQAQDMLKNMTPEQMQNIQEMMKSIDPQELERMKKMYEDMDPTQREKLMKQAKNMGEK